MTLAEKFVLLIVVLMACASICYAIQGDWRKFAYWAMVAAINVVVTW